MRKSVLLAILMASMPLLSMAQDDDLYFNPKQEAKKEAAQRAERAKAYAQQRARRDSIYALYWSGSTRSVDEYNRGGRILSLYQNIATDSTGNDIITFRLDKGVRPDSIYDDDAFVQKYVKNRDDDFEYTRDLCRWDGYYDPWFYDYYGVGPYYWRSTYWGWRNPWRYGYYSGWYDPWYDPFFDPWYYGYAGWYGGWYDPWYYGWGGYYRPWYGPAVVHVNRGGGYPGRRSWGGPTGPNNGNVGRFDGGRYNGGQFGVRQNGNHFGNMTRRNAENRDASTFQRSGSNMNRGGSSFGGGGVRSGGFSGGGFGGGARSGGGGFSGGRR